MAADADDPTWVIQEASAAGHLEDVQRLFEQLATVRAQSTAFAKSINDYLESALCAAARNGHAAVVSYLLDQGQEITRLVLRAAKEARSRNVFQAFRDHGWNLNSRAILTDATSLCANLGDEDIVKWHLENGADPNIRSARGYTALEKAAYQHSLGVVKLLVEYSADLETNTTALHGAASDSAKFGGVVHPGRYEVIDFLLARGADINQLEPEVNPSGNERYPRQMSCYTGTPLHHAVESQNPETVRFLLSRGADRRIKGAMGLTPLEVAQSRGLREIVDILSDE